MKHKKIAVAGFAASMLLGAGTGLVLNLPGSAGASNAVITATTPDDTTDTTVAADTSDTTRPERGMGLTTSLAALVTDGTLTQEQSDAIVAAIEAAKTAAKAAAEESGTRPERGAVLTATLAELVTNGTVTQEQSDAVTAAIEANRPAGGGMGGGHGGGHGMGGEHGGRGFGGAKLLESAATALGITADELKVELEAGKTIADVATEKGIDVQTVIDAIVAEQTLNITERVTNMVNGVKPTPAADTADASDDEVTTTTTG